MNAKPITLIFALLLATLGTFLTPMSVAADTPPDVLESYTVSIAPQQDGTLAMDYQLKNYCTYSDWPGDQPYLQVGVPNPSFEIKSFGPAGRVVNAEPVNGKFVQLNFDQGNLPKNGDCFDLNFSVTQADMARPDPTNQNVTFEFFAAGWNFPIQVKKLTINWELPADPTLIKVTDPTPSSKDTANITWTWDSPQMDPAQMFSGATVKLAYDKSAFTLPTPAPVTQPVNNSGGGNGQDIFPPIFIVIAVIVAILILFLVVGSMLGLFEGSDTGLGGDTGFDTTDSPPVVYHTRKSAESSHESYTPPSHASRETSHYDPPPQHYDPPSSSGGGFGGSSGHSSGCASMPSCACACACAGGGKVGCMLKMLGIKIGCLKKVIDEMVVPTKAL